MNVYSIVPPFENWNSPMHSKWSICACSVPIINDISDQEQAERLLSIVLEMDEKQIVADVLSQINMHINQSPFSSAQIDTAYRLFKENSKNL